MGSSEAHGRRWSAAAIDGVAGWRPRVVGGLIALVAASAPFIARLSINARVGPAGLAGWMHPLSTVAVAGPALGVGVIAVTTDDDIERVGLTFLAVFGLLAAVVPAATVPAVAAAVGGGAIALSRRLPRERDWRVLPAVAIVLGVALTAVAAMGVGPNILRTVGAHLTLLGAAGTPALIAHGNRDWALGGIVGGVLVGVGLGSPFLTGAVALVGGGIVTSSLLVMAVGLCGLVTTASAAARTRRWPALFGAGLLVVAGVPATLPRVLAAVAGVLLLAEARGGVSA